MASSSPRPPAAAAPQRQHPASGPGAEEHGTPPQQQGQNQTGADHRGHRSGEQEQALHQAAQDAEPGVAWDAEKAEPRVPTSNAGPRIRPNLRQMHPHP